MSKSYENTIPIFASGQELHKLCSRIVTDMKGVDDPKDPDTCNIFALYSLFATDEELSELREEYRKGISYSTVKELLEERIEYYFSEERERRKEYEADPVRVQKILLDGAEQAREIARITVGEVRQAIGL